LPLSALRAIELGSLPAAAYCTRLLADFGAEVIKLEPPEGDKLRRASPFIEVAPGRRESAAFAFLNFGKHSLVCDPRDTAALLAGADIAVISDPGFDAAAARSANPALILADISWFGRSGPYAGYAGADAVCRALAGLVQLVGPAEGPPLVAPEFQALVIGGLSGAIAILAALMARRRGDAGHALEVSVHEACIAYTELQTADSLVRGFAQRRIGINRFWPTYPVGLYRAADGWLGVTLVTPAQWQGFCAMLGLEALGANPAYTTGAERIEHAAELEAQFEPKLRERSVAEWFAEALARRLPIVPVPDMASVLATAQFRERGAIVPIRLDGRVVEGPGSPWHLTKTPPRRGGAVPALGTARVAPHAAPAPGRRSGRMLLEGVRIVDLSMGWAGPLATRHLGDLGADIVKVEACQYPDWWRGVDFREPALSEKRHEKAGRFNALNRNKRGVTLDLTTAEGVAALKGLVGGAAAVVENYAAGVLEKLGLDYPRLSAVNPSLVMLSMCAFGSQGPWRDCRAYGSTLEHASGLPSVNGRAEDPPVMGHIAFGDATGGLNGAAALLVALLHRDAAGEGQHIDLAQVECMLPMAAPAMMVCSATGAPPPRTGNRHPDFVPHGVFPAAGGDAWVVVAVTDDAMWRRCAHAIGRADLAAAPALGTAAGRREEEDAIELAVADWTRWHDADAAMALLQAEGVAAGVVRAPLELFADPQLLARGFWQYLDRPFTGRFPQAVLPFREAGVAFPIRTPAPTLGQHTDEVLRELLGYSAETLAALAARGVTGSELIPGRRRSRDAA
jgi:crotonobetainyl-CoA:carnitine CoA-transferase CaiB-like acyl-CoA transferase